MPIRRDQKNQRKEIKLPDRRGGPPKTPADPHAQRHFRHQGQPDRSKHHDHSDENENERDDFRLVGIDIGGLHLIGFQSRPAGDADLKFGEILSGIERGPADGVNRLGHAGQRFEFSFGVNLNEDSMAGTIGLVRLIEISKIAGVGRTDGAEIGRAVANAQLFSRIENRPVP